MKVISISLSNRCVKKPRCSFCYLDHDRVGGSIHKIRDAVYDIAKTTKDKVTLAFEYNGYNINYINNPFYLRNDLEVTKTVTTMPSIIDKVTTKFLKNAGVQSIALSYDSEKVKGPEAWLNPANHVKYNDIHLSCNFLIENIPFEVPKRVIKRSDQINLLSMKPNEPLTNKERNYIEQYINRVKSLNTDPTLDNCLGVQLGYEEECKRGSEFLHVKPNGEVEDCCFKNQCYLYEE